MTSLQWVAVDPGTGKPIESLPGLRLESSLPSYVGRGDQVSLSLPVPARPKDWMTATEPNRAVLVCHFDDEDQTILWAGPMVRRSHGSGPTISVVADSVDGWLDRNQVGTLIGDYAVTGRDQSLILADLLAPAAAYFHGHINVTLSGVTRDLAIADSEDKTLATAISALMGLDGGPEYRIGWEWDSEGCLCLAAQVGPRIGTTRPAVLLSGVEWTRTDDYTSGRGATIVTATATNSGTSRPQSTWTASDLLAAGYLPVEIRWTPDTAASATEILAEYAWSKLQLVRQGTAGIEISFRPSNAAMINRDFHVGDVIQVDLSNPDMPEVASTMVARMLGFTAEADRKSGEIVKITPVFQEA